MSCTSFPSVLAPLMITFVIDNDYSLLPLQIAVALLLHGPGVIEYIWRRWTTVGSIYSEIESLHELSDRIDCIFVFQKNMDPPLSQESQATVAGLEWRWSK